MDTAIPRRIVQVEATFPGHGRKLGTGLRLKPGWVLTSQHLLELHHDGKVQQPATIEVRLAKSAEGKIASAPAEVAWRGEESLDPDDFRALDVALLEEKGLPEEPGEAIRLVPMHLPSSDCELAAWIWSSVLTETLETPDEFSGRSYAIDQAATFLPLRIDGLEPKHLESDLGSPYGGISGAPVFVASGRHQGWLYGVLRKGSDRQPDRLYAVSTSALLRDEGFRRALGIEERPPPHENLILATRRLLCHEADLAARLAELDPAWHAAWRAEGEDGGVDGLLVELCEHGDLEALLGALEVMAKAEPQNRHRVRNLRRWAGHLTGLLAHQFLARDGRRLERQGNRTKVPVGSPNFGAALHAAEQGESPRYEWRDGTQRPAHQVPASQLEAGIRTQRWAEDQLERMGEDFVGQDLATPRYLSEIELKIIEGAAFQERFETRLAAMRLALQDYGKQRNTGCSPFLAITPDLRQADFNGVLDGFLGYLADRLPELEQLELDGPAIESLELEHKLKPLWRILGIDQGDRDIGQGDRDIDKGDRR